MNKIYLILVFIVVLFYNAVTGFNIFKTGHNSIDLNHQNITSQVFSPVSVSSYIFSQSTGTYTPASGGTSLCVGGCDDGYYNTVTLPFSFIYNGTSYINVTVSCNGWIAMGSQSPGAEYSPICNPGNYSNFIVPFARDLYGNATGDTLRYKTTGNYPNRIFTIEWFHWGMFSSGLNELDFQVQLFETSNLIKFIYNPENVSTSLSDVACGIMGSTNADYLTRTTTSNWSATTAGTNCSYNTFNVNCFPPSGLTFIWTPPATQPPPAPSLLSPDNNSTGLPLNDTLKWTASSGALSYRIQVATDSNFTNLFINDSTITSTFRVVSLTSWTKYYWRVNAKNNIGTSAYSSVWNFTTLLAPPTLIYPANNSSSITLTPLIDWSDVNGASTYNLQVSISPGFTSLTINLSSLSSSQYQVPSGILQANTIYYWRASSSNSFGTSGWSAIWNFTTLASPNTPNLISPTNNSNILTLTPTLYWSDVTGATSYTVQVASDTSFLTLAVNQGGILISHYQIPTGALTGNTTYYWRVKAINETGSGPWSVRWTFRVVTTPPAPNLIAPPDYSTNQPPNVLLVWDSLTSATSYHIQLASDSLFNSIAYDTTGVNYSHLQMYTGILLPNVIYYWKVNASNLAGTGPWSDVWNFRVSPLVGISITPPEIPKEYKFYNNYPNPFNPRTNIKFDIPKTSNVSIVVLNVAGQKVDELLNKNLAAGSYTLSWDASALSSGIYFCRLTAGKYIATKKMVLIK